jgi:GTP-binding protein
VFLLIDIRHEPSDNDIMMYDWMVNQGFAPIIIATKSDKLKKSQIAAHIKTIKDVLHVKPGTVVIPFSSMSKEGRDEIWNLIDSLVFDEETLLAMKPHKKERWKKTGKPVAKKTKERRDKAKSKKSVNNHKKK